MQSQNFRKVNLAILRTHCEDAAFLFTLREKAIEAPNYRIIDVYDIEERMRGHLAAILCAGEAGASIAADVLAENRGSGEMFVASHVAVHLQGARGVERLLEEADPDPIDERAVAVSLAWCLPALLATFMPRWIDAADPRLVALALDVCAEHRVDPRHHLAPALELAAPRARGAAFRVAGCCGRDELRDAAVEAVNEAGAVGCDAAVAATLLGDQGEGPRALFRRVAADPAGTRTRLAAELAPLGLPRDEAQARTKRLLERPETARWGVVALGSLGLAVSLDWLVGRMDHPLLARVAGAAFAAISGADLKDPELEMAVFPEAPADPVTDANPAEAFYESTLPWPEAAHVAAWLDVNRRRFAPDTRHLYGAPAWSYNDWAGSGLRYQAQFRALALELAMRAPSQALPNWHAPVRLRAGAFTRAW